MTRMQTECVCLIVVLTSSLLFSHPPPFEFLLGVLLARVTLLVFDLLPTC